jgi:hypothetical protein
VQVTCSSVCPPYDTCTHMVNGLAVGLMTGSRTETMVPYTVAGGGVGSELQCSIAAMTTVAGEGRVGSATNYE